MKWNKMMIWSIFKNIPFLLKGVWIWSKQRHNSQYLFPNSLLSDTRTTSHSFGYLGLEWNKPAYYFPLLEQLWADSCIYVTILELKILILSAKKTCLSLSVMHEVKTKSSWTVVDIIYDNCWHNSCEAAQSLTFQADKYPRWRSTKAAVRRGLRNLASHHPLASLGQLIGVQRITGQAQASSRVHLCEVILANVKQRAKWAIQPLPSGWRGNGQWLTLKVFAIRESRQTQSVLALINTEPK